MSFFFVKKTHVYAWIFRQTTSVGEGDGIPTLVVNPPFAMMDGIFALKRLISPMKDPWEWYIRYRYTYMGKVDYYSKFSR